jgi:hypothetical protein
MLSQLTLVFLASRLPRDLQTIKFYSCRRECLFPFPVYVHNAMYVSLQERSATRTVDLTKYQRMVTDEGQHAWAVL